MIPLLRKKINRNLTNGFLRLVMGYSFSYIFNFHSNISDLKKKRKGKNVNKQQPVALILICTCLYSALCVWNGSIFWLPTNLSPWEAISNHASDLESGWQGRGTSAYVSWSQKNSVSLEAFRVEQWVEALFLGTTPPVLVLIYTSWDTTVTSISVSFPTSRKGF